MTGAKPFSRDRSRVGDPTKLRRFVGADGRVRTGRRLAPAQSDSATYRVISLCIDLRFAKLMP
jgi:hypothetical protein